MLRIPTLVVSACGRIPRISDICDLRRNAGGRAGGSARVRSHRLAPGGNGIWRNGSRRHGTGWNGQEAGSQFGTGSKAELLEDVPDVGLDGVLRNEHRPGDLPVRPAARDQGGDAALGLREPFQRHPDRDLGLFPPDLARPHWGAQLFEDTESAAKRRARHRLAPVSPLDNSLDQQGPSQPRGIGSVSWSDTACSQAARACWRSPTLAAR
jgi:hypothetical protein